MAVYVYFIVDILFYRLSGLSFHHVPLMPHFSHLSGYSGSTCSEDLDGCVDLQCYPEVVCVDLPPPSLVAECATCPNGTTGDGQDCEDYNECVNDRSNNHDCTTLEYCRNVVESFVCDCIEGYERNSEGLFVCLFVCL